VAKTDWVEPAGIKRLAQSDGINAVLHARFCPHGYQVDVQIVQYMDGTLGQRARSDFSDPEEPEFGLCPHECRLDLASVFESFRASTRRHRKHDDVRRGRFATITLAVDDRFARIMCQPPMVGEPDDGSVIDQLWRLFELDV
jgi:hypothetical protein